MFVIFGEEEGKEETATTNSALQHTTSSLSLFSKMKREKKRDDGDLGMEISSSSSCPDEWNESVSHSVRAWVIGHSSFLKKGEGEAPSPPKKN